MSEERPDSLDLLLAAGRANGRDELFFTIVNRSVAVCRYDRASLWKMGMRPSVLALSGTEAAASRSAWTAAWSAALRRLKNWRAPAILDGDSFWTAAVFPDLAEKTGGLSAIWVPLPAKGVGVLFERWGREAFTAAEKDEAQRLVDAYGLVWKTHHMPELGKWVGGLFWLAVLVGIAYALSEVRVPLRVVATCEVAAKSPRLVSAPMDGVIDEVLVSPGQRVREGDRIAVYDSRLMEEELKISRRQVAVVEAELASARARGFADARYRGETALLEARLEQEMARLEALEVRFSRRVVTAPRDGMVQLDDARAWRGRPVATGQAILWLVDPDDTRLDIWLPQDDRIDIEMSRNIDVYLAAMPGAPRQARLTYVSTFAQATPDGAYSFPAEAEWVDERKSPPLGLRGSAAIYGEETTLGYWLLRRPVAWLRRWLGV